MHLVGLLRAWGSFGAWPKLGVQGSYFGIPPRISERRPGTSRFGRARPDRQAESSPRSSPEAPTLVAIRLLSAHPRPYPRRVPSWAKVGQVLPEFGKRWSQFVEERTNSCTLASALAEFGMLLLPICFERGRVRPIFRHRGEIGRARSDLTKRGRTGRKDMSGMWAALDRNGTQRETSVGRPSPLRSLAERSPREACSRGCPCCRRDAPRAGRRRYLLRLSAQRRLEMRASDGGRPPGCVGPPSERLCHRDGGGARPAARTARPCV